MIHTLDLIIKNCSRIDINYLINKGIKTFYYTEQNNKQKTYPLTYEIYKLFNYKNYGITFKYKDINFKNCWNNNYLLIQTNMNTILNKDTICCNDRISYQEKVLKIVKEIIPTLPSYILVDRIDYKVDIKFNTKEELNAYFELLDKHDSKYKYTKKKIQNSESIYLTNKGGQFTFNFYKKEDERLNKGDIQNATKYKNVLRMEIQNKPPRMKANANKEKENPIKPILINYFCKEGFRHNYLDVLSPYLYEGGNYYTLHQAKILINRSNESSSWKNKLKNFLVAVNKYGGVKNTWKSGYCTRPTSINYVEKLVFLGINPITIDKDSNYTYLENLMKIIRNIANTQYFC